MEGEAIEKGIGQGLLPDANATGMGGEIGGILGKGMLAIHAGIEGD